jgi:hypothetical protein
LASAFGAAKEAAARATLQKDTQAATVEITEVQEVIDRRRLTRAIRAEQAEDLARLDLQVERIERDRATVVFG